MEIMSDNEIRAQRKYHNRCRDVCFNLDMSLVSFEINKGFTYEINHLDGTSSQYNMPHELMEGIESLIDNVDGG